MRHAALQHANDQAQHLHRAHRLRRVLTWIALIVLGLAITSVVSAAPRGTGIHLAEACMKCFDADGHTAGIPFGR